MSEGAVNTFLNGNKSIVNNNLASNMLEVSMINEYLRRKRSKSRRMEGKRDETH